VRECFLKIFAAQLNPSSRRMRLMERYFLRNPAE
jgi:hypothetical protein